MWKLLRRTLCIIISIYDVRRLSEERIRLCLFSVHVMYFVVPNAH